MPPAVEQATANALGADRFQTFIAQISRRIAGGKSVGTEVIERAKSNSLGSDKLKAQHLPSP